MEEQGEGGAVNSTTAVLSCSPFARVNSEEGPDRGEGVDFFFTFCISVSVWSGLSANSACLSLCLCVLALRLRVRE